MGPKCVKILCKGDHVMGKTRLMTQIVCDWANGIFTSFTLVFFVLLKLVNPEAAIENVIVEQNPAVEDLNMTSQKLRFIHDTFGNKCLLVLDGLTEHALDQNEGVLKVITGQKFLNCCVIVSSEIHSTLDIEKYFPTIVRIDGFNISQVEAFASKIISDHRRVQNVLNFNPTGFLKDIQPHKCPTLLSFM